MNHSILQLIELIIMEFKIYTLNHPITHLYHSREIYDGNFQPNYNKNVSYITDGKRNFGIIKLGDVNKYRGDHE